MKYKIIIPMAGILAALVIITTVSSMMRFTGYTTFLFNERIVVAANGLKRFISDCESDTRIAAVTASANTDIMDAVNARNTDEIVRLLTNSLDLYHVDFFAVTDETGTVLARTFSDVYGDSILYQTNIQEALKGNVCTYIEEGTFVKISVRTGAPVYNAGGALVGVMSAGIRFDSNDTLDLLKEHYNADFTVSYEGKRIATTIFVDGTRMTDTPLSQDMLEHIQSGEEGYSVDVDVLNNNYSVFYKPLTNARGETFSIIVVGYSNTKLNLEKNTMQRNGIIIGLSGLIVSIVIMLLITGKIVKPINHMEYLVSEVTRGNMNVDIDRTVVSRDEIGSLTLDIYSLVDVIKMILSDLSRLSVNLDKFENTDFQIDTGKYSGSYKEIIDGIKKLADSISMMKKTMAVMDHLDTMISVVDFDYKLLYVNSKTAEAYGVDRENSIGKKCYKAIRNLDKPCAVCQLPKLLPDKDSYPSVDFDSLLDETSGIYIGGRAAIIRWVDGGQVFFNSFRDETIKMRYQEQLRKAMTAAEDASVAKSAFLANMSHEIRTPMNSIIGFSELALDSEITPKAREYLSMIKENARGLLEIINDILDISKVESGNVKLESILFDQHELFDTCRSLIMPKALEKNIDLNFHTEPFTGKKLLGDPLRLRQVLINLLSNAVKFTNSGSVRLSVTIKNETENTVTLQFEVKDTGIGMTEEQITRIFEPFMQADISTTRKYGGTGLGLAITKNIVELMGGSLRIESVPGMGTTIGFELVFNTVNITDEQVDADDTVKELDKPVFAGEVLVCEDNQMNQRVITEHLARVGLSVEIAENGREGIDRVQSRIDRNMKPFDLILMDIHMPVMDGIEAAMKIIKLGTGTPIVAITANIMAGDRELYKTLGMNDHIGKPFTSQELWRCLLKYLKPVSFVRMEGNGKEDEETNLQTELKTDFVRRNQTMFEEIQKAMEDGDIKLAHRLAHTLKGNAGLIGRTSLRKAAAELESALKGNLNRVTGAPPPPMSVLQAELSATLDELAPYLKETANTPPAELAAADFNADKARELLEKLEPLLKSGNPECIKMAGALRAIPGSGELIRQIEDFCFSAAAKALSELKEKFK